MIDGELLKKAEAGDGEAITKMAFLCWENAATYFDGYMWAEKAYEKGMLDAVHHAWLMNLAFLEDEGNNLSSEKRVYVEEQAIMWLNKAIDLGDCSAMNHLADCYANGYICEKDEEKAHQLALKSAYAGNALAAYNLATDYIYGNGCEANYIEAVAWALIAGERGYTKALCCISEQYYAGTEGFPQAERIAYDFDRIAANKGDSLGMYRYALCFARGEVCERNFEEAAFWMEKAILSREEDDILELDDCLNMLQHIYKDGYGEEGKLRYNMFVAKLRS